MPYLNEATKLFSTIVHMITISQNNCPDLSQDWDYIKDIANSWNKPEAFFTKPGEVFVNGKNIYPMIDEAIKNYSQKNYKGFGQQLGIASQQIMIGKCLIEDFGYSKLPQDQENQGVGYFHQFGAQFAAGFIYGLDIDDIALGKLTDCMVKEP